MYLYETHLHTYPVSGCSKASVRECVEFYKNMGYKGLFITNHFIDGNMNYSRSAPYAERIEFYFSDYEEGKRIGEELGIDVFCGIETSYGGTDFLVYGLDKAWFLAHPEIAEMKKSRQLPYYMENGALVIQAHPFREAGYIDHIRLFPRCVHGVEATNTSRIGFENEMARIYAEKYNLIQIAGSDNHVGAGCRRLGGIKTFEPIADELDMVAKVKNGEFECFTRIIPEQ